MRYGWFSRPPLTAGIAIGSFDAGGDVHDDHDDHASVRRFAI
jgi:hypothetical protein